jgi:hypothetical protein
VHLTTPLLLLLLLLLQIAALTTAHGLTMTALQPSPVSAAAAAAASAPVLLAQHMEECCCCPDSQLHMLAGHLAQRPAQLALALLLLLLLLLLLPPLLLCRCWLLHCLSLLQAEGLIGHLPQHQLHAVQPLLPLAQALL